ncbi:MAG: hypothetical protein K9L66_04600 [Spirochaetaceae bacterium]|nr:hypothetical protein [Spirochaetaceae bacterium]MCF7949685.1 hypothetical protein [Spirochaetia bacterium]MCF7950932.1 hypothetical protein [Spirochaetaceae bacterium]
MKRILRTKTLLIVTVVSLLLISLTACTGGSSLEVSAEWEIVTEGLAFNRGTIAVPPGEQIVIQLKNSDNYTHYFGVYRTEGSEQAMAGPTELPANTSKEFSFTAPEETGVYYFRDHTYPTKMNGVMIVSDKDEVEIN